MTRAFKATYNKNVALRKRVEEQEELLNMRKSRKKGKQVALKGSLVFSTQEVLEMTKVAEANYQATSRVHDHASTRLRRHSRAVESKS